MGMRSHGYLHRDVRYLGGMRKTETERNRNSGKIEKRGEMGKRDERERKSVFFPFKNLLGLKANYSVFLLVMSSHAWSSLDFGSSFPHPALLF
jgi:hypothetical protein